MIRRTSFLMTLALLTGCGGQPSHVTGKVTLAGKPLAMGRVTYYFTDGTVLDADIKPDGTYDLTSPKPSQAKVTVRSPKPQTTGVPPGGDARAGGGPQFASQDATKWINVPTKYADPETSGLEYDGKANTRDLELSTS